MKRLPWLMLLVTIFAAALVFDACRSGGGVLSSLTAAVSDDDLADDDDNDDNDDNDDTSPSDDDTFPTDDDASPADDDVSPGATALSGEIQCYGCTGTVVGRPVRILLYTTWVPANLLDVSGITAVNVPAGGFPFTYTWDLSTAGVAAGNYYVFAFLDVTDGDGFYNPAVDPARAPVATTAIVAGQSTTLNLNLAAPGK